MYTNHIGEKIRFYRQAKGLSQDQLSKASGVSYNTIVKLERKSVPANPTIDTLWKIARILGISIGELIETKNIEKL
jgi:transcriptional regulator with XRE-family HTH domain